MDPIFLSINRNQKLPFGSLGIRVTGDDSSSLYIDPSRTEIGLRCSGALVASSAIVSPSSNLGVDFYNIR